MSEKLYLIEIRKFNGDMRVVMDNDWDGLLYDKIRNKLKNIINIDHKEHGSEPAYVIADPDEREIVDIGEFVELEEEEIPPRDEFVDWTHKL
jgi:hypothetical protein